MISGGHLIAMLASGAEQWNAYRQRHPGGVMLNFASLRNAQLAHLDLHGAFLLESDLQTANLAWSSLAGAIMRKSDLRGSDLRYAIIDSADLFGADLSGADLRYASLTSTFLKRANLRGADLSAARGLTARQIEEAFGDGRTRLPNHLARPAAWSHGGAS